MKKLASCLAMCGLLTSPAINAHEFWLLPDTFSPPAGAALALTLNVGEQFEGSLIGFIASQAASLNHHATGLSETLTGRIPAAAIPAFRTSVLGAGTHLFSYDSRPSLITLPAEKFHAYLHDEGLDSIIEQRTAAGKAEMPGRERYRRCVKTLVRVGGKADAAYAIRSGQRLEIVSTLNPLTASSGGQLDFTLMFDDKPLAGNLIKAWHKRSKQTVIIRTRTDQDGKFSLSLPYSGTWMISVVHMIPAEDTEAADWDSFWGNLTFELLAKKS